ANSCPVRLICYLSSYLLLLLRLIRSCCYEVFMSASSCPCGIGLHFLYKGIECPLFGGVECGEALAPHVPRTNRRSQSPPCFVASYWRRFALPVLPSLRFQPTPKKLPSGAT